jgi:asparagine synthase (glutamine-hydrolysing)
VSGILGVFDLAGGPVDVEQAYRMGERQRWRGGPATSKVQDRAAFVSVSRYDWELSGDFSGNVLVLDDSRYIVAADACIFYQQDLRDRLLAKGTPVEGDTASHLILAAYKAWGQDSAEYLEGMFAFIVFDRETGSVFCARDYLGMRPLFFARFDTTLVIASSICAILEYSECSRSLNVATIAAAAAGWLVGCGADTCYEDVQVVPQAGSLLWVNGKERSWRHWDPPLLDSAGAAPFAEAADELRELLARAVSERLAAEGCSAVWMSGGRDSTAVFAAGQHALSQQQLGREVRPVSISYPEGDLGREDELIQAVADRWGSRVHWLDIDRIPMFDADAERAATREQPGTSPYENWNVALAQGARSCGARIALDGNGGDQLFRVHDIYLSDLLRSGRFIELARELWSKRSRGRRHLFETTIQPLMSDEMLAAFNRWRGHPEAQHYLQFPLPQWLRQDFVDSHNLIERQLALLPDRREKSQEAALMRWYLTCPLPGYAYSVAQQRMLEVGVDVRAPLIDQRIIEFAFRRPRRERLSGVEDKLLLRESMRGLIPDHVLAPRDTRTGVTISYSKRSMRKALPLMFEELLKSPMQLAELDIIEPERLRGAVSGLERGGDFARIALFHTLQAELWLRARTDENAHN